MTEINLILQVVIIAKKDFNKEMGLYISKRREKTDKPKMSIKLNLDWLKGEEEKVPEIKKGQVHVEYKRPGRFDKIFSFRRKIIKEANYDEDLSPEEMAKLRMMEDDIEDTEKAISKDEKKIGQIRKEEQALVEKREGMLKKLFGKLHISRKRMEDDIDEEEVMKVVEEKTPKLDEDVKEAFKVIHKWIEQLSPAKKRSFKASKDFQAYKNVLQKYGLIKNR